MSSVLRPANIAPVSKAKDNKIASPIWNSTGYHPPNLRGSLDVSNPVISDPAQAAGIYLQTAKENLPRAQSSSRGVVMKSYEKPAERYLENIDRIPNAGPRFINRPHGRPLSAIIEQRSIASLRSKCSAKLGYLHPKAIPTKPQMTGVKPYPAESNGCRVLAPRRWRAAAKGHFLLPSRSDSDKSDLEFPTNLSDRSENSFSSSLSSYKETCEPVSDPAVGSRNTIAKPQNLIKHFIQIPRLKKALSG